MPMLGQIPTRSIISEDPFQAKLAAFEIMGYKVHAQPVADFHASRASVRIVSAPARTSKSYSAAPDGVAMILPTIPLTSSLTWCVGPTYGVNKEFQYFYEHLIDHRDRWPELKIEKAQNNPQHGNMLIVINWGKDKDGNTCRAIIEGKSATNPETLQGEHVSHAIMSEAAEHPETIWTKYLSTRYSWATLPTTPKPQAAWIRSMIEQGENDPSLGIAHFTFPPEANPLYDFDKLERERKLAENRQESGRAEDDPYFAEQFLGEWVYYTGRVLPFGKIHIRTMDPRWLINARLFVSCDYGYDDACVALFWAIMPNGTLLIFHEIYGRRIPTVDFVRAIDDFLEPMRHRLDYVTGDPKKPEVEHYMRLMGLPVSSINKNAQADREVGTRRLIDLLSHPKGGQPGLFVASHCTRTIAEWTHLRYREGHTNEYATNAIVGADHAFDAARYGVMTLPANTAEDDREIDWIRHLRKQEERHNDYGRFAELGLGSWERTGRSPYG